jgi:RNA polymerase sigma factor (TIGR02999 family)
VDTGRAPAWNSRGHFFVAAAEAMRRILVERYRQKQTQKRGGLLTRRDVELADIAAPETRDDLIALDEALKKLEVSRPKAAQVVKLRYFSGFTIAETAGLLEIPTRTADRLWSYARVWLLRDIRGGG